MTCSYLHLEFKSVSKNSFQSRSFFCARYCVIVENPSCQHWLTQSFKSYMRSTIYANRVVKEKYNEHAVTPLNRMKVIRQTNEARPNESNAFMQTKPKSNSVTLTFFSDFEFFAPNKIKRGGKSIKTFEMTIAITFWPALIFTNAAVSGPIFFAVLLFLPEHGTFGYCWYNTNKNGFLMNILVCTQMLMIHIYWFDRCHLILHRIKFLYNSIFSFCRFSVFHSTFASNIWR